MLTHRQINTQTITGILLWCGVLLTGYYFFERMIFQEKFGFHDWYLFIAHAKSFVLTGVLYNRDLMLYEPAAAIYKFPPIYASLLVFFLNCGLNEETIYQVLLITYPLCYFLSIIICLVIVTPQNRSTLIPLALIIAFTFEPFFDNYTSAQMEIYILLLISLGLLYLLQGRDLLSGFFIGVAAAIKIYPIYFAGYYVAHKKYSALIGIVSGLLLASIFSLALTGWSEHVFYFFHILPTLLTEHISGKGENISLGHLLITMDLPMKTAELICLLILLIPIVVIITLSLLKRHRAKPHDIRIEFCIFITLFLLATKNSWWNYQILLIIPLLFIAGSSLERNKTAYFSGVILLIACLMIFWCNLGKLETLILWASAILDALPLFSTFMLKINLLRGLGTFLVLMMLVFLLCNSRWKNISLVENRFNT
jgi:hypothetical protein